MKKYLSPHTHLIFIEHVVSNVNYFLHVDDAADAVNVHICEHGEHQNPLHQQLTIFRHGYPVQHRLHVHCKLDLPRGHLRTWRRRRRRRRRMEDMQAMRQGYLRQDLQPCNREHGVYCKAMYWGVVLCCI